MSVGGSCRRHLSGHGESGVYIFVCFKFKLAFHITGFQRLRMRCTVQVIFVLLLAAIPPVATGGEAAHCTNSNCSSHAFIQKSLEYYLHHNRDLCPLNRKPPRSHSQFQPGHINGDFPAVVSGESRLPLQPGHQEAGAHTR